MKCESSRVAAPAERGFWMSLPSGGRHHAAPHSSVVAEYNSGSGTVLLTSQYMADVETLCRRVLSPSWQAAV